MTCGACIKNQLIASGRPKMVLAFIKMVLAFFASSDGIIIKNLVSRFMVEIQSSEIRAFYSFQNFMKNVQSETYSILIDTYIKDSNEKYRMLNAIYIILASRRKWIGQENGLGMRIVVLQQDWYLLRLWKDCSSVLVLHLFFG